ncbi:MAG: SWIM zinc finger family protein [Bacilli bacterium]
MRIVHYKDNFPNKILERGRQLWMNGAVTLDYAEKAVYYFYVKDTAKYEVTVITDFDHWEIEESHCTCTIGVDSYCQHQAAAMFYMSEGKHYSQNDWYKLLEPLDKAQMLTCIAEIVKKFPETAGYIVKLHTVADDETQVQLYRDKMNGVIDHYHKKYAFFNSRTVQCILDELDIILKEIDDFDSLNVALQLYFDMLELLERLRGKSDDSKRYILWMIQMTLERIQDRAVGEETMDEQSAQKWTALLVAGGTDDMYGGLYLRMLGKLKCAVHFCKFPSVASYFEKELATLEHEIDTDEYYEDFERIRNGLRR